MATKYILATLRGWSPLVALQAKYSLLERNLRIAREVDLVAEELGATAAQVAVAWLRQRDRRVIPILGARKLEQLQDVLGSLEVGLAAKRVARLDEVSQIDLPSTAPYRWR